MGGRFEDKPLVEVSIRATLGLTYLKLGEYRAAEPHLERARALRRRLLGEENRNTATSMNDLGVLYKQQGRYDEAEPLYLETLEIRRRVLGDEHPNTWITINSLIALYDAWGKPDKAAEWRAKLSDEVNSNEQDD